MSKASRRRSKPGSNQPSGNPFDAWKSEIFWPWVRRTVGERWFMVLALPVGLVILWSILGFPGFASAKKWCDDRLRSIPHAQPGVFTVAVARFGGDEDDRLQQEIAQSLGDLKEIGREGVLRIPRTIAPSCLNVKTADSLGDAQAHEYLTESGADLLLWGNVAHDYSMRLHLVLVDNSESKIGYYPALTNYELPGNLRDNLKTVLATLVLERYTNARDAGDSALARLTEFANRLAALLGRSPGFHRDTLATLHFVLANARATVGSQKGDPTSLIQSIEAYNRVLGLWPREREPWNWALTQGNKGSSLAILGNMESDTTKLVGALLAHGEALKEYTQERTPREWARTTVNFGIDLTILGELKADTTRLREAVRVIREGLEVYARQRASLDWAWTQTCLSDALVALGKLQYGTVGLEEAVTACGEALSVYTPERQPWKRSLAQISLGIALTSLGERQSDTTTLVQAVGAFGEALKECTQERMPWRWALIQHNLGTALRLLGDRQSDATRLQAAVMACSEALKERTRELVPLEWGTTQYTLGTALSALGKLKSDTTTLMKAVKTFNEALEVCTRALTPFVWAEIQNSLGNALYALGTQQSNVTRLAEAVTAYGDALKERTRDRVPLDWAITQENLGLALGMLAALQPSSVDYPLAAICAHLRAWQVLVEAGHPLATQAEQMIRLLLLLIEMRKETPWIEDSSFDCCALLFEFRKADKK
jgi:tetratricopeptide (TPR) repeat protein